MKILTLNSNAKGKPANFTGLRFHNFVKFELVGMIRLREILRRCIVEFSSPLVYRVYRGLGIQLECCDFCYSGSTSVAWGRRNYLDCIAPAHLVSLK